LRDYIKHICIVSIFGLICGLAIVHRFDGKSSLYDSNISAVEYQQEANLLRPIVPVPEGESNVQGFPVVALLANHEDAPVESGANETNENTDLKKVVEIHAIGFDEYLQRINSASIDELLVLLAELNESDGNLDYVRELKIAAYRQFGELDIETALDHILTQITNLEDQYAAWQFEALSVLVGLEFDFAKNRVEELYGTEHYLILKSAIVSDIAKNSPDKIVRELLDNSTVTDKDDQFEFLSVAMSEWVKQDPEAAWEFVKNESSIDSHSILTEQVLNEWLDLDPDAALVALEKLLNNDFENKDQLYGLSSLYVSRLAKADPHVALHWTLSQEDRVFGESVLVNVIENWDINDPDGLEGFVNQLDPAMRDRFMPLAASAMVQTMVMTPDPHQARQWLHEQSNPEVQVIGSIYLDALDTNVSTETALENIAGLNVTHRESMLLAAINERLIFDPIVVEQWISTTDMLSINEREVIEQMIYERNHAGKVQDGDGIETEIR